MRFSSIGSGSEGNGLVVEAGSTRVMIDCGFGVRDTAARLARIGIAPESLDAIVVTHEHDIAEYATRVVTFRDGRVVKDEPVANRRDADTELALLPPIT